MVCTWCDTQFTAHKVYCLWVRKRWSYSFSLFSLHIRFNRQNETVCHPNLIDKSCEQNVQKPLVSFHVICYTGRILMAFFMWIHCVCSSLSLNNKLLRSWVNVRILYYSLLATTLGIFLRRSKIIVFFHSRAAYLLLSKWFPPIDLSAVACW